MYLTIAMTDIPVPADEPRASNSNEPAADAPPSPVLLAVAERYMRDNGGDGAGYFAREIVVALLQSDVDYHALSRLVVDARRSGLTYSDVIDASKGLAENGFPVRSLPRDLLVAKFLLAEGNIDMVLDAAERGFYNSPEDVAKVIISAFVGGDENAGRAFEFDGYDQAWRASIADSLVGMTVGSARQHSSLGFASDAAVQAAFPLLTCALDSLDDPSSIEIAINYSGAEACSIDRPFGGALYEYMAARGSESSWLRAGRTHMAVLKGEDIFGTGALDAGDGTAAAKKQALVDLFEELRPIARPMGCDRISWTLTGQEVAGSFGFSRRERRQLESQLGVMYDGKRC